MSRSDRDHPAEKVWPSSRIQSRSKYEAVFWGYRARRDEQLQIRRATRGKARVTLWVAAREANSGIEVDGDVVPDRPRNGTWYHCW
jgi:hypothetical protein